MVLLIFLFKQKTAYEMRISDWSSDVCSSDLVIGRIIAVIAIAVGIGIGIIIIIIGATGIAPAIAGAGHVAIIAAAERRRRDQAEREGEGAAQQSCHDLVLSRRRNRRTCPSKCSRGVERSEEHTSELQSLMRISYAV